MEFDSPKDKNKAHGARARTQIIINLIFKDLILKSQIKVIFKLYIYVAYNYYLFESTTFSQFNIFAYENLINIFTTRL